MIKTISFLASHGGSTARKLIDQYISKNSDVTVGCIITNNANSEVRTWATEAGYNVFYISSKTHPDETEKDAAIFKAFKSANTDLIILSGYMKKLGPQILLGYRDRILNIHPSLLPKFGGKGMFGDRVHQTVLESNEKESGATVHIVDENYDEGPIVVQQKVSIAKRETVESLRNKIQNIECDLFVEAIVNLSSISP